MIFQASILRTSSSPVPASFLPAEQKPRANTVLHGAGLCRLASYRHGLLVLLCKAAAATTFGALGFQECLHCLPRSPLQALARKKGYNAFKARIVFQLAPVNLVNHVLTLVPTFLSFKMSSSNSCRHAATQALSVLRILIRALLSFVNVPFGCFWPHGLFSGSHGCRNLFNELEERPLQVAALKSKISCRFIPFPAVATFRLLAHVVTFIDKTNPLVCDDRKRR